MGTGSSVMAEEAFASFDWKDERWVSYLDSVTIPADRPYDATVERLKRKWFKKHLDDSLEFDASTQTGVPNPTSNPVPKPAAPKPAAPAPAAPPPATLKEFVLRRDTMYLLMSAWLLFNSVLYLIPMNSLLSQQGYHRACNAAFIKSFAKLLQTHGTPSPMGMWRTVKGVMNKEYESAHKMQTIVNDKNLHNAFLYFMFNAAPPIAFAIFPIALTSLYTIASYASGMLALLGGPVYRLADPLLQKIVVRGKKNPETGMIDMFHWIAWMEFAVLTALTLQLFTPARSFMLVLVFGQFLMIRYTSTGQSGVHTRMAAAELDAKITVVTSKVAIVDSVYCKAKTQLARLTRRN